MPGPLERLDDPYLMAGGNPGKHAAAVNAPGQLLVGQSIQLRTGHTLARGVRQLTTQERDYYQKVIAAMQSQDPKQALANVDVVMPETVIELDPDNQVLASVTVTELEETE